eukprot:scaffold94_cov340-Prasinococcus_capsulatus_cf.AAC.10
MPRVRIAAGTGVASKAGLGPLPRPHGAHIGPTALVFFPGVRPMRCPVANSSASKPAPCGRRSPSSLAVLGGGSRRRASRRPCHPSPRYLSGGNWAAWLH